MADYTAYELGNILKKLEKKVDAALCCCETLELKNLGLGVPIYVGRFKNNLKIRSLIAGTNMNISYDNNTITFESLAAGFSCSDLNFCSTSNLPEGSNLYYTDARVLSYMTGQNVSIFTNNAGYITSSALTPYLTISSAASTYYPIPAGTTLQYLRGDGSLATFPTIPTVTPSALTKTDDTNVTLTLGGTPSTALLQPTSLTLGWTGTLADSRITSATTWNNKVTSLTAGTGISIGGTTTVPIVTNTLPDQTVTLTAGTGMSITGTYPSFTLTNTSPSLGGTVTSVGLSMPSAFNVGSSPVTTSGTIAVTGAGVSSQYIRGDGTLANFPVNPGGGSSVSYYLNGSVNQGVFGGNTYYEMSKTANTGATSNFSISADGYIAQFITSAGDPNLLNIPAGNWDFQIYFSASSSGGSPQFYTELYKYNGAFTLISSGSVSPETITGGTIKDVYIFTLSVPATTLTLTDRLAIRIYVVHNGRTITMYTQDSNLAEVHTTFSTGLAALNGLTNQVQYFATGSSGTDFNISSVTDTHTFNLPTASAVNRGLLSITDWSNFNNKLSSTLTNSNIFVGNLSNVATSVAMSGDATISNTGAVTIANNAVTDAKLRQSAGLSLIGRATNSAGNVADITALTANSALRLNSAGTAIAFSTAPLSVLISNHNTTAVLSSTNYIQITGAAASVVAASIASRQTAFPIGATAQNMYVKTNAIQPASGSLVISLTIGATPSALSVTIAAGSAIGTFSNTLNAVSIAAGNLLTYEIKNNATATSATIVTISTCFY